MKYSKSAIGLLTREYRSVLKKCLLINLGLFALGVATLATPANAATITERQEITANTTITDAIAENIISTGLDGGVIKNSAGLILNNGTFAGNKGRYGGVLENYGTNTVSATINGGTFTSNTASETGGVIDNDSNATLNIDGATFLSNEATHGGVIYNWNGNVTVKDSTFDSNKTPNGFGASLANGAHAEIEGSTFNNNTGMQGGNIMNFLFAKNKGQTVDDVTLSVKNSTFSNNTSNVQGAAIDNFSKATIENSTFTNNKTTTANNDGGGAMFVGAESITRIVNSTFDGNSTASNGGAIMTRSANVANNSAAKLDIIDSTFTNNTAANGQGGALYLSFYNSQDVVDNVNVTGSTFDGNSAKLGGAVYISDMKDKGNNYSVGQFKDSSFKNNSATEAGGALWVGQNATANIKAENADVVFENNKANGVANDLHNAGTTNVDVAAEKTVAFKSGITGANQADNSKARINLLGSGTILLDGKVDNNKLVTNGSVTVKLGENGVITNNSILQNWNSAATLDLRNGKTDTIKYTDLQQAINVYADAVGNALDQVAGAAEKKNLQGIQISSLQDNLNLDTTGYTVTDAAKSSLGAYYDNIVYDSTNNKITAKKAGYADLIGIWEDGNYIKAYDVADTANTSVAANLKALDDQVFANAGDIATNAENIAANTANISTNTANIATNAANIATNAENIAANTTAIAGKQAKLKAGDNVSISDSPDQDGFYTISATDTKYENATASAAGLMSAAHFSKLEGIEAGAQVNKIESVKVNGTSLDIAGKAVNISAVTGIKFGTDTDVKTGEVTLAKVAQTGSYNDLSDKPTNVSTFANDAGYLTTHQDISGKADIAKLQTTTEGATDGYDINAKTLKVADKAVLTVDSVIAADKLANAKNAIFSSTGDEPVTIEGAINSKLDASTFNGYLVGGDDDDKNDINGAKLQAASVARAKLAADVTSSLGLADSSVQNVTIAGEGGYLTAAKSDNTVTITANKIAKTNLDTDLSGEITASTNKLAGMTNDTVQASINTAVAGSVKYTNIPTAELPNRKAIVLNNHDIILGTDTEGHTYNLAMLSKWDVADFGSSAIRMNLNSKDGIATLNDNQVVLTDQLLNKVVAANGNIVMTESDETTNGVAHKKYTFSTNPALDATSLALTSTGTAEAALTMNDISVNSIDQVEGAAAGNNVLASKATVNKAVTDSILKASASDNIYKDVMADGKYAEKAVSAGALKQIALQVGTNMQADQLGWNINVDPTKGGSFAKSLTSTFYNGLENKTVIGALNKAGDEIAANTNRFEDRKDGETVIGKKTVVESIQDALSNPKQDIVADDITANTLTLGESDKVTGTSGKDAAAIALDDNDMPYVAAGSEATLATTASLNQAVNNVLTFAGQTFNAKQQWLDGFTGISSSDEEGQQHAFETSFAGTYNILEDKDGVKTTNMNLAKAFKNIDSNMGKIHGLVGENGAVTSSDAQKIVSTTGTHSNLAKGTSVEMHLVSLDNTIGDRSKISNEKGTNDYEVVARDSVADVLTDIYSQIGKASDLTSTINGVALTNTVNANISAVNSKLGDVSTLNKAKIDAVKTSTNAIDAILALDGYLNIDTGLWNNIDSLKNPDSNPRTTATNIGSAIQYLGLYVDSKKLVVANDGKTATIFDDKVKEGNNATFYTTAGAEAKFYAKDEQLDGSQIGAGSIAEGSLAPAVVAKLTKAENSVQGIEVGGENFVTLSANNKLVISKITESHIASSAFDSAPTANSSKLLTSGAVAQAISAYTIKSADTDEFNVSDAGVLSVKKIDKSKINGLGTAAAANIKTSIGTKVADTADDVVVSEKAIRTELDKKLDAATLDAYKVKDVDDVTIAKDANGVISVKKIGLDNIADAAFGNIAENGTNLVRSGVIYTALQGKASLNSDVNFSGLTLGGAAPKATAISNGNEVSLTGTANTYATTLATELTVQNTAKAVNGKIGTLTSLVADARVGGSATADAPTNLVDAINNLDTNLNNKINGVLNGFEDKPHTWKDTNTFEKKTIFEAGMDVTGDVTVNGNISATKATATTVEATNLKVGANTVTDINTGVKSDGSADVVTGNGSGSVLATTATVMASAENAKFTADDNPAASLNGATTINQAINNVASAVDTNTRGIADLNNLVGTLGTITADYAKTIDATTGNKSDPADIATAINNVATAAAKADGTLNFTEAYTTSNGTATGTQATNLTDAINNVARNAAAAAAGISAEIHGIGTEIAPAGEVKVGNLAATTTVGTVDSNDKLTGMKVSSTATVDTDEDGTPDSKALNIAVSGDGRSTNIDMTETEASMTATNNGRTVGMLVTNNGSDTHTVSLGEDDKYVIEIDTDAKTTKFGKGDGKEVVIGEGDITADKSVTVGSVEGDDASGVKLDATDGSITSTGNANIGGNATVTGDLSAAGGNFTVATDTTGTSPVTTMTLTGNANITGDTDITGNEHVSGDVKVGTVDATTGDVTSGVKLGADGTLTTTGNATVGGALGVTGKTTLSADNGMAFGTGQTVKGVDDGANAVTGNGSAETLATTASVMKSAENAKYTNNGTGVVKAKNVATLHDAIQVLDNAMGTMDLRSSTTKTFEKTAATDTDPAVFVDNATDGLLALDGVVGNVKALDGTTKGNLDGANKSVAEHLKALDKRLGGIKDLGTNSTLAHTNLATTASTAEDGITASDHFNSLDVAMGDRVKNYKNNSGSNGYVAQNDGSKDLTTMISEVASNIGTADDIRSTNQISARQTVNANLSSLDAAIGNVGALSEELGATDLTSAINNLNTKVNESNGAFSKAINKLDMDQRKLRHDFEAGMAGQAALSALVPNAKASGNTQLAVGTGAYKGHTAAAVGGFHWFTDNLLFNAGVAWDNNEATGRMGITYSW